MGWARRRLDVELVRRGLAGGAEEAGRLIASGRVLVAGARASNPAHLVARDEPVELVQSRSRFVGRGGGKLDAALDRFGVDVAGRMCLDAGASTGGFTDCLLQRGARSVFAVDVGHGLLDASLRADPRVTVLERTNVRDLDPVDTGGPVEIVVADLSFISLASVAPALTRLAVPQGHMVLLVKPQFEASRPEASRVRGVVRDPALWRRVLAEVGCALEQAGSGIIAVMASPFTGAAGNAEFFLHAGRDVAGSARETDYERAIAGAQAIVTGGGSGVAGADAGPVGRQG